jgi:hypothetical protein
VPVTHLAKHHNRQRTEVAGTQIDFLHQPVIKSVVLPILRVCQAGLSGIHQATMALRQFGRVALGLAPMGTRAMAGAPSISPAARWSQYFPKAPGNAVLRCNCCCHLSIINKALLTCTAAEPTPQQLQKNIRKEVIGFVLLGPISAALMVYDLIWGLEHHEPHPIPP